MKTKRKSTILNIIGISFLIFSACNVKDNSTNEEKNQSVLPVKIASVQIKEVEQIITATGTIRAFKENHIGPASPGRINKIYVEVGDKVKKGDILVQMDRTQLQQVQVQFETLKQNMERMDTLLNIGSISKQKHEQLKAQYDITKTNLDFLSENTRLVAPINGIITGKYQNDGEIFSMAPNPMIGKAAIVSVMQINPLKVFINVSESYFPEIKEGMKAKIRLDIYPEEEFTGKIYLIHPTIDPMTRTFTIEIIMDNNSLRLRPGMFARIELTMGKKSANLVPSLAVLKQTGTNDRYVFIYKDGKAIRKIVQIGRLYDDQIEVKSGIDPGENLIISGQRRLLDGTPVEVVK